MVKRGFAEFIGTAVLVVFGCGVAMTNGLGTGYVGIALAFGLVIVAMAYSVGNVSGCHVNPAVSVGMLVSGRMSVKEFIGYVVSQFAGAIVGALILLLIFGSNVAELGMGTNGFGEASALGIGIVGAFITEVVLTFVFVFAILGVTSREKFSNISGVIIGLTLTLVHLMGLPITGTSVNPARSFGPALILAVSGNGTSALAQVPVFIIAPIVGAAAAAVIYKIMDSEG